MFNPLNLYSAPLDKGEQPGQWLMSCQGAPFMDESMRKMVVTHQMWTDKRAGRQRNYLWGDTLNDHFARLHKGHQPGI